MLSVSEMWKLKDFYSTYLAQNTGTAHFVKKKVFVTGAYKCLTGRQDCT